MANDIFGGIVKGLGAFMPKDDPTTILFKAQTEINDLDNREQELYSEIGKKAFDSIRENPEYCDLVTELNFIRKKKEAANDELKQAQGLKTEKEKLEREKLQSFICSNCYTVNPEGVKFCQECGTKLVPSQELLCPSCGEAHGAGARFCGACGSSL